MATTSFLRSQGLDRTLASVAEKQAGAQNTISSPLLNPQRIAAVGKSLESCGVSRLGRALRQRSTRQNQRGSVTCRAEAGSNDSSSPSTIDHIPVSPFYKVEAIIRSWRLQGVTEALVAEGIRGLTVIEVRGFGAQRGSLERQAGSEFVESAFLQKTKIEIVVVADQVDTVINTVIDAAKTEEIGDGKIFVSPVYEVIRVRTGERGVQAERMAGGRADLLNIGTKD